jgi:hypothetical protein
MIIFDDFTSKPISIELIQKPIYFHINKNFRMIFLIGRSIDYSKSRFRNVILSFGVSSLTDFE